MVHGNQDISFDIIPIDNDDIELKEKV